MLIKRVIPILLLKNGQLYKTKNFSNPKYIGDPINAIKIFNDKGVDEIIILDIDCTTNNKDPDFKLIEKIAQECFMPICYGGGIKNEKIARNIFSLGVEKISINTPIANENFNLIKKISDIFGSQALVASIDLAKNFFGNYNIKLNKKFLKNKNWIQILEKSIQNGVGEILIQNYDKEGTMTGADLDLVKIIAKEFTVPVIYSGGINSFNNIQDCLKLGVSAVGVGSYFVLYGQHNAVLLSYLNDKEKEKLNNIN